MQSRKHAARALPDAPLTSHAAREHRRCSWEVHAGTSKVRTHGVHARLHDRGISAVRLWQPCQHGVGLDCRVRDQSWLVGRGFASEGVVLMPGGEGCDDHAGIDSFHRRVRSSVSRTTSAVSTGISASATAATPSPSSTSRMCVAVGTISSRPSRSAISNDWPAASPRASRSALGMTTRPAGSMTVLVP